LVGIGWERLLNRRGGEKLRVGDDGRISWGIGGGHNGGVIVLTGFPGFIGTRLVARLLADADDDEVVCVAAPAMAARGREVAAGLDGGRRVTVVPGDISLPRLGLDDATYERLGAGVREVHHLAAIYDLAVGAGPAERVNVAGTRHIIELCRAAPGLERHHYVSTAYVAGTRSGLIGEDELAAGQAFKNHYESTKFAAEVLVRASMEDVPTTIYRPAIVIGDSHAGETQKFDGPYYMLRAISRMGRLPLPQIGRGDAAVNVVPVDFVVDAIAAAAGDPETIGQTLHLVDPQPISSAGLNRAFARAYAGREPAYRLPSGLLAWALRFGVARRALGVPRQSIVYLNHPVAFDTRNADALRARAGLTAPVLAEYLDRIVAFFVAHEDDPAFVPGA
jgi:thioester reductase-like protein